MIVYTIVDSATWDRNRQADTAAGLESPEPGRVRSDIDTTRSPDIFAYPRQPFAGFRAVKERIVQTLMPGVPKGPPRVIANREQTFRAGRAPGVDGVNKVRPAADLIPATPVLQATPWYEYVPGYEYLS